MLVEEWKKLVGAVELADHLGEGCKGIQAQGSPVGMV